jgi:ferredoxin
MLTINFKKIHKWVALIVFVQLLIWLVSGFLLGKVDHSKAAGRNTISQASNKNVAFTEQLIDIQDILKDYPLAKHIELLSLSDMPVYRVRIAAGTHSYQRSNYALLDASKGTLINFLQPETGSGYHNIIYDIAQGSYKKPLNTPVLKLLMPPIEDLPRERNPVWQIDTQDSDNTHIYVRANTAQLIAHVNDETRWRDLLLMLHFMDYLQEGSFNNIFIKILGFFTFILSATGLWWIYSLARENQIKLKWWHGQKTISLLGYQESDALALTASKNSSVLNALLDNDIPMRSVCGGGGVCGTCKFKSSSELKITEAETSLLTKEELALGLRLSCQHTISEVSEVALPTADSRNFSINRLR